MSKYIVQMSGEAQDSITAIYRYIRDSLCNRKAAEVFLDDTEEAVNSLEQYPYAYPVRAGSKLVGGCEKRQYFYRENYVLFYVIKEDRKIVRIIRVAYTGMDLDRE